MKDPVERFASVLDSSSDRLAVVTAEGSMTTGELVARARGLARVWSDGGIAGGSPIALQLANGPEFVVAYLACLAGGFTAVPVNRSLPARDVDHILATTRPALVLTAPEDVEALPETGPVGLAATADSTLSIAFTSGTTARPKGVGHSAAALLANALVFAQVTGLGPGSRMLHVMPMGYMAGYLNTVLCPLAAGGTIVVGPRLEAATAGSFWSVARRHDVNAVWLTPTMVALLTRLTRDPSNGQWARDHLRHVFVGTAPLPRVVADRFEETFGVRCRTSYGMTETLITSVAGANGRDPEGSVGRPLPGVRVEVRDEQGASLPPDTDGELWLDSPFRYHSMVGQDPDQDQSPESGPGWLRTGDRGRVDRDGHLFITGRSKDLIIRGGTNISPVAVEEVLLGHPCVLDAAVVGEPDPFWGERIVAYLIVDGPSPTLAEIGELCKDQLVPEAVPGEVRVVTDLPRSATGKVQKHRLRSLE